VSVVTQSDERVLPADGFERALGEFSVLDIAQAPADNVRPIKKTEQRARRPASRAISDFGTSWLLTCAEGVVIVLTGVASGILYSMVALGNRGAAPAFAGTAVFVAVFFCGSMRIIESSRRFRTRLTALRDEFVAWISVFLLLAFFAFSMKAGESFSRGAVLTFFVSGFAAAEIFRSTAPRFVAKIYGRRAFGWNDVLLVGSSNAPGMEILKQEVYAAGFPNCASVPISAECSDESWPSELRGGIARILDLARTSRYGEIYVTAEGFPGNRLTDLISGLQLVPRAVRLVPDPGIARLLQMPVHNLGQTCAVELQKSPLSRGQWVLKRSLDLALALPVAIIAAPLMCLIAVAIKLDSRGPVIFRQTRLGYRSRPFEIFKFRTMTVLEDGDNVQQASKGDSRVTRVGRFLRKTSLDELPQIINVIKSQMSLVGPRPHARSHDSFYAGLIENYEIRQHVKPGISGWAQVNGLRGETSDLELMRRRVEYDIWYAKNASIALDIAIMLRTIVEVFRQKNAY
jgi:Undecaprenyl-phosphate glucose phosphotransferase